MRSAFSVAIKVLFALVTVMGVIALIWYLEEKHEREYVEIYNDYNDDFEGDYGI